MCPLRVCSAGMCAVARPRYWWASWPVQDGPGARLERHSTHTVVRLTADRAPSAAWADAGWELLDDSVRLPTFVRSIPKKKPTFLPAGIAACNAATKARWKKDEWRFAPYQYKSEFLLRQIANHRVMRPPSATERERLTFLGTGYIAMAIHPTVAKKEPPYRRFFPCWRPRMDFWPALSRTWST